MSDGKKTPEEKPSRKRQGSQPIGIPGASDDGAGGGASSSNMPLWVAGGSPAKFVSHEEILKMSTDMENLELIHEIAIDPNFKIPDKPANPIQMCVKENMHKAYYNSLRKDLAKNPPEYEFCFNFLMELKNMILEDILTQQHVRLRAEINANLDEATLRDKLDQDALDIHGIMKYIIDLLSRLCAPERDDLIVQLRQKTDVIDKFQGTMDLLELMKNDLANYEISKNRAAIEEFSEKREYEMFQKFLADNPNGCDETRKWLTNAYDELAAAKAEEPTTSAKREKKNEIEETDEILIDTTSRAYVKLVQSENPEPFPETMKLDKNRMQAFAEKYLQMAIVAASVMVTCNLAGKEVSQEADFKKTLKEHLIAITNRIDQESLNEDLEKIGEQCVKEASETAKKLNVAWSDENASILRKQIMNLANPEFEVRKLVEKRVAMFVEAMLNSVERSHRLQPGLSVIQHELFAFTAKFIRICIHNRKTFHDLYHSIIMETRVDRGETATDRSMCREASPSEPGPSTSN
ncbi:unnamed protein product [Caenorhabditis bovis]|uniref:Uncharacterized protein n=1 Tax=Caenorhabditis bovis TaxID=2654633 RepID=A0A8S1FFX1_9PELO|nr:unnamed protein product [Caenorhabditis bovis]